MDIQSFKQQILQHIQQSVASFITLMDDKVLSNVHQQRQTLIENTVSLLSEKILDITSKQDVFKFVKQFSDNRVDYIVEALQKNSEQKYEQISDTFFTYIQQLKQQDNEELKKGLDKLVPTFSFNIPEEQIKEQPVDDLHSSIVSLFENNKKYLSDMQTRLQNHYEETNISSQQQITQHYEQKLSNATSTIEQYDEQMQPEDGSTIKPSVELSRKGSNKESIVNRRETLPISKTIKNQVYTPSENNTDVETKQQTERRSIEWDKLSDLIRPFNKFVSTNIFDMSLWKSIKRNAKTIGITSGIIAAGGGIAYALKQVWDKFDEKDIDDGVIEEIDESEIEKMFAEGNIGAIESIVSRKQYTSEQFGQEQMMQDSAKLSETETDLMNTIKQWGLESSVKSKQGLARSISKESVTQELKETFQYMGEQGQWSITAAKEEGHAAGKYSHSSGDKLDISTRWKSPEQIAAVTMYMINKGYRPVYEYNSKSYSIGEEKIKQGKTNVFDTDIHTYLTVQAIKQSLVNLNQQRSQKMQPAVSISTVTSPIASTEHLDVNLRKDVFGKETLHQKESFIQPNQQSIENISLKNEQFKVKQKNEHERVQDIEQQIIENKKKYVENQQREFEQQITMQSSSQLFESTINDSSLTKVANESLESAYKATRPRTYIK